MENESYTLIKTSTLDWLKLKLEWIEKQLLKISYTPSDEVYSEKAAAKRLSISLKTLQNLRAKGEITFSRYPNGRRILYRETDLLSFMEKNKVKLKHR